MLPPLPAVLAAIGTVMTLAEMGQRIYSWIKNDDEPVVEKPVRKVRVAQKTRDCTRFTKRQYDFICVSHRSHVELNVQRMNRGARKITLQSLADKLNGMLNLNKSERTYARVWNRDIDRETLALGKPVAAPLIGRAEPAQS